MTSQLTATKNPTDAASPTSPQPERAWPKTLLIPRADDAPDAVAIFLNLWGYAETQERLLETDAVNMVEAWVRLWLRKNTGCLLTLVFSCGGVLADGTLVEDPKLVAALGEVDARVRLALKYTPAAHPCQNIPLPTAGAAKTAGHKLWLLITDGEVRLGNLTVWRAEAAER